MRNPSGTPEDERDVKRGLVREEAVGLLSVVPERFAVVRGQ